VSEDTKPAVHQGRVVVLGTGGTIAGKAARRDDLSGYVAGQVSAADLVAGIPGLDTAPLEVEQVAQIDSKDMGLSVWQLLVARLLHHLDRDDVQGVVITHGTDTLEETAYLLHALLRPAKPVVLTCAMRPATALAPDGPQNLSDAVLLARTHGAKGVLVLCASKVHGAVDVTKVHPYATDAFDSGEAGMIGVVEHGQFRRFRDWPEPLLEGGVVESARGRSLVQRFLGATELPRVELVFSHAGATGDTVRCLLNGAAGLGVPRLRGIVVAATGNGSLHQALELALQDARAQGVSVLRGTRCPLGRVLASPGNWPDTNGLSPVKARLALALDLLEA
jgi:L-asparaginase